MPKKIKRPAQKSQKSSDRTAKSPPSTTSSSLNYYWITLGIIIFFISLLRFRQMNIPLERDEGEYAYIGKLLLNGTAPYTNAYTMKLPGTSAMYAFFMMFFGHSGAGIHFGLILVNIATMIFLFLAFRKLFNPGVGLFSAAVFGMMALSPTVLGFAAHATHFIIFFVSIALFFLSRFYENKKWITAFLTGLMFGLAFLMKQQAVFFILFGGIAILMSGWLDKPVKVKQILLNASAYSGGVIIPYALLVLMLKAAGAFDKFWFWTVDYAGKYATGLSMSEGIKELTTRFKPIWLEFPFFWIFFFAGIFLTFLSKFTMKQKLTAILFTLFAFLTICTGFYFRRHYFIAFLPAIGLLAAIAVDYINSLIPKFSEKGAFSFLPVILFGFAGIFAVSKNKDFYFNSTPNEISKKQYGNNPFIESGEIAKYIKAHSDPTDKIAILGSEPQICFYADRLSATGYIYTYPLVEAQPYNEKMQEEMISEIEKSNPKYFVYCLISASWLVKPGVPDSIFNWVNPYTNRNYQLTGVADIYNDQTIYKWDDEATTYQPKSPQHIMIYRRKG